jgi:RNA polymerase sigma-70 factor (ECF subfamily)
VKTGRREFEAWYREEHPRLVRALWAVSGDRNLAAEVVDEACSRALARWSRVSRMDSPGGWARTVAMNLLRRTMRRRALEARLLRRARAGADALDRECPTTDVELWAAVAALPRVQRSLVALRYVGDWTEAEAARALGISEGAASAALVKARRRLAESLNRDREVTRP